MSRFVTGFSQTFFEIAKIVDYVQIEKSGRESKICFDLKTEKSLFQNWKNSPKIIEKGQGSKHRWAEKSGTVFIFSSNSQTITTNKFVAVSFDKFLSKM